MKARSLRVSLLLSLLALPAAAFAAGNYSYSSYSMPMMGGYGMWGGNFSSVMGWYGYGTSTQSNTYRMPFRCMPSSTNFQTSSFQTSLTPGQEVPPRNTSGMGQGSFRLDDDGLWYRIRVWNLSSHLTAAHFHLGAAGVSGPVIQPISFSGDMAEGTWKLTDQQRSDLLAGKIYVNVHTTSYPDGEIRGQLYPSMMWGWGW